MHIISYHHTYQTIATHAIYHYMLVHPDIKGTIMAVFTLMVAVNVARAHLCVDNRAARGVAN